MIVFEKKYAWAILIYNMMMLTYQRTSSCFTNFSATGHQISLIFDMLIDLGMMMIVFEKDYAWAILIYNLMIPTYQKTLPNFSATGHQISLIFDMLIHLGMLMIVSFWKRLSLSNSYL